MKPRVEPRTKPIIDFSTRALPLSDKIEAWHTAIKSVYRVANIHEVDPVAFDTTLRGYNMGYFTLGQTDFDAGSAVLSRRDARLISTSGADQFIVQFYTGGELRSDCHARGARRLSAGDIAVFDLSQPFASYVAKASSYYVLIERDILTSLVGRSHSLHGMVIPAGTAPATLLLNYCRTLWTLLPDLSAAESAAVVEQFAALFSATLRTGGTLGHRVEKSLRAGIDEWLKQHLSQPDLDARRVQERFGLSRTALFRLFADEGGLARYIRSLRLEAAHRELILNRHKSVTRILYDCGFSNERAFQRAFKAHYGSGARELRRKG